MKKLNSKNTYLLFITLFIGLNIINTYFLTIKHLNRYIEPFLHTFFGEINQILGNFVILFLLVLIFSLIFKKAKSRIKAMILTTLFLNVLVYALGLFNLFYGTAFSRKGLALFRNPADGFAFGVVLEILLELITYYRIVVFFPVITLTVLYILSDKVALSLFKPQLQLKRVLISLLALGSIFFFSLNNYSRLYQNNAPVQSMYSTFAVQNLGVYPYYLGQLFGINFTLDYEEILDIDNDEELISLVQSYNKNQESYINFFDGQTYSNRLMVDEAVDSLYVDPALSTSNDLTGILKDKNLVLIHLESLNQFLLDHPDIGENFAFLKDLFKESFVLNNVYTNVGMGVSSDGELSILSGLNPVGDETLYWEYNEMNYDLTSLVKYFNELNYYTEAIHGDKETFYNRDVVYPDMYTFDDFYSIEDFIEDGYIIEDGYLFNQIDNLVHDSPWVSDFYLADYVSEYGSTLASTVGQYFLFPITMMGHTPFDFDPYGSLRESDFPQYVDLIQNITLRYINYSKYYNDTIQRFFMDEFGNDQTLDDSVYVFYSDHGSGIKNGDLSILFDEPISSLEERRMLQQISVFLYVPSNDEYVDYGDYQIRKGMLTGEQDLVRSQVDVYRTIIELFDLPVEDDMYFGVHAMSKEPTFALDNRITDVILDDYIYSMRNRYAIYPENETVSIEFYDYILRYKILSDYILSEADLQTRINELIKDED
ncbi:MAG: sulfatase-like hydrolase/transferase [Acholeplasmataceae bacterium]|nr:sulfatase-like hydrolase/transferase [Acholeplasmataceae bacterium]